MGESLTERRRVWDEGLRVVNHCQGGKGAGANTTGVAPDKSLEEAPANSVPAAAVIRRVRTLFGFIGLKGHVGGGLSRM